MPGPIIAVDFDDTISQTNVSVVQWHNDAHGTDLTLEDIEYYHYWKTRGWGDLDATMSKVHTYYSSPHFLHRPPVPGALAALARLKAAGYTLVIVTSRPDFLKAETEGWLGRHLPGVFDDVHYTGEFVKWVYDAEGNRIQTGKTKAEVLNEIGALTLIDDCLDHALSCALARPSRPVLLFGDYPWGKRRSPARAPEDFWDYERRVRERVHEVWATRDEVREGEWPGEVRRVSDWGEVERVVREVVPLQTGEVKA